MRTSTLLPIFFVCLVHCSAVARESGSAAPFSTFRIVKEWRFQTPGDLQGWKPGSLRDVQVKADGLRAAPTSGDPILTGPEIDLEANEFQWVRVTMRCPADGHSELFFTNTTQGPYGGFSGKKVVITQHTGGPKFQTYDILPFWQAEKKIIRLRFDPPSSGPFEIQSIQILEDADRGVSRAATWDLRDPKVPLGPPTTAPVERTPRGAVISRHGGGVRFARRVRMSADDFTFITARVSANRPASGRLFYALSDTPGVKSHGFTLRADGRIHACNLQPGDRHGWSGTLLYFGLEFDVESGGEVVLESVQLSLDPAGPADFELRYFGPGDVSPTVGRPVSVVCSVYNHGGDAADGQMAELSLPAGLRALGPLRLPVGPVRFGMQRTLQWNVVADRPTTGQLQVAVGEGENRCAAAATLVVGPSLGLAKAEYVPEPKPIDTGPYEVGVYYFPGWCDATRWGRIQPWPERKPALGWYREGSPEVADWHIKWMLEHGIRWIAFDWYWSKGSRHLEHALHDGFFNARYQHLMKFCLLYANHNAPGTTSLDDSLALTKYWIDHYFKRPNYLRVDGRPVMIIFSTHRISDDMGHAGVKSMFEAMNALCRKEGIPGIYFVACAGPDAKSAEKLKEEGYDALSGYNYSGMGAKKPVESFTTLAKTTEGVWAKQAEVNCLPLIPVLAGGWDPRPWHGSQTRVFYTGMTPSTFADHCRAARQFLDQRPSARRLCLVEAWNEWGEGSIIEPHAGQGFGLLDAMRDVFAPNAGPHVDLTPADVGLGPYDVKPAEMKTAWEFNSPGDTDGWSALMQVDKFRSEAGSLKFAATGRDPAILSSPLEVDAGRFSRLVIRMKADRNDAGQLYWSTTTTGMGKSTTLSFKVAGDGQFHDYALPVGESRRWRGMVTQLRLDPGATAGNQFAIDAVRLE